MKHTLSTMVRTIGRRRIDGELAVPVWNLVQITAQETKRTEISIIFWNTIGVCIRRHIADSVLVSVGKNIKNEITSTSS